MTVHWSRIILKTTVRCNGNAKQSYALPGVMLKVMTRDLFLQKEIIGFLKIEYS
jgi:hypothetical protein